MLEYIVLSVMTIIILIIIMLISIAFLSLLERKILGYIQDRKGPNKVGYMGIFQPFSEVIKLFSKEMILIKKSVYMIFYIMPLISMLLLMIIWLTCYYHTNIYFMNYSIVFIIIILSLNSYMIMMMGWSSNSMYSMIGSIRSVVQVLSYEVSFIMIIMIQLILSEGYSLIDLVEWQSYIYYLMFLYPMMIMFFISILAELNRSPMDFIEGESELVSGFNVEYFSSLFALIFLVEYGMIIFMSYLLMMLYMGNNNKMLLMMLLCLNIMLIICIRGILPRMRYDELMYLCWKIILPMVLVYLFFFLEIKIIFSMFY